MYTAPAASRSTVYALMYSLRLGCPTLSRQDVQQRLAAVDERQMHDICARLQKFKAEIAKPWTADEVERLVIAWVECHGR